MPRGVPWVVLFLSLLSCAPSAWRGQYLAEQMNVATREQVRVKFGEPTQMRQLENGDEVWIYQTGKNAKYGDPATYAEGSVLIGSGECVMYALTFDKQAILRSWLRQGC